MWWNVLDRKFPGKGIRINIKPTQKFKDDFNLVLNHYQVDTEEAKQEKERVEANYNDAAMCYAAIADEIKRGLI